MSPVTMAGLQSVLIYTQLLSLNQYVRKQQKKLRPIFDRAICTHKFVLHLILYENQK